MTPCPRHRTAFGDEGELEMPLPLPLISTRREYDGGHNMTGGKDYTRKHWANSTKDNEPCNPEINHHHQKRQQQKIIKK